VIPCAVSTAASADGEQVPPAAQSTDRFCAGVPRDFQPFSDVEGNQFQIAIECVAYAQVARGGPGDAPSDRYVPDGEVRRDAMASSVVRVMDLADQLDAGEDIRALPPYDGTPSFSDIAGNTHEAAISRLADAGAVQGGSGGAGSGRYGPGGQVTRGQMATFLDRSLEYLLGQPITTPDDYYTDDRGDVHELGINDVSSVGIASGRAPGTYAPGGLVDRDNMAVFLARTLGELEEREAIQPVPAPLSVTPDDTTPGRLAFANPDRASTDNRTYQVSGLIAGQEYRITVVDATTTTRRDDGQTVFTRDGDTNLAAVGPRRSADILTVDGAAPKNNTGDGTDLSPTDPADTGTAVFVAASGTAGFVLDLDGSGNELVIPVVYRNGGPGNDLSDGGSSPRLELGADGVPVEAYDVGGAFRSE
jgi:hypothetical protein